MGERLPVCDPDALTMERLEPLPTGRRDGLEPLVKMVEALTANVKQCEAEIERIARDRYPETALLRQVSGVGTLIALTFVLTVEDPQRFRKSRDVGCYVGLRPKRSESGESQPQLPITPEGDRYLRKVCLRLRNIYRDPQGERFAM